MEYFGQIFRTYPGETQFWVAASVPVEGAVNMGRYATRAQVVLEHGPAIGAVCAMLADADYAGQVDAAACGLAAFARAAEAFVPPAPPAAEQAVVAAMEAAGLSRIESADGAYAVEIK